MHPNPKTIMIFFINLNKYDVHIMCVFIIIHTTSRCGLVFLSIF
jgi:hypothetical protein